ncbi:hypothetical protein EOT10_23115 [Streptomyces antnestii]|uniref:Carboxypeptidase regulatory-like domain-containing protein n=1 Tax=Streptomyces antnestii TaxID=2494256 RepID=A0A3S2W0M0_9ACTN|nr:hypothetical protein [Streptomyces sp. San01]RVU22330.1 hypothetical protein EOT10_23115 [Streptomyces sp. San01]
MRTTQIFVRSTLTVAAAAALPLTVAAPSAFAGGPPSGGGIAVTANGSTVQVSTRACRNGGTANLLSSSQARQAALSGGTASFQNVSPGTYTVTVICTGQSTPAGTQSVTVSSTPTISATSMPARGVQGGLGGSSTDHRTATYVVGGALVGTGVIGSAWFLRRRGAHHRT